MARATTLAHLDGSGVRGEGDDADICGAAAIHRGWSRAEKSHRAVLGPASFRRSPSRNPAYYVVSASALTGALALGRRRAVIGLMKLLSRCSGTRSPVARARRAVVSIAPSRPQRRRRQATVVGRTPSPSKGSATRSPRREPLRPACRAVDAMDVHVDEPGTT